MAILKCDKRSLDLHRKGGVENPQSQRMLVQIAHMGKRRNFGGLRVSHWWALVLTSALLLDHQYWSLSIAINSGPSTLPSVLDAAFQEFVGLPHQLLLTMVASFGAACLNTTCYHGLVAIPALVQLGLCTLWVYTVMRNFILLGVLAWYSDAPVHTSFSQLLRRNLSSDALFISPALVLYLFFALSRPALLMLYCSIHRRPVAKSGRMSVVGSVPCPQVR